MSHGSYTSLDSLAQNGIIDFDANSYLTGAPSRYAGRPYAQTYSPFQQPLMSYDSFGMMPQMGYMGGGLGPMNSYYGPWSNVRPSMHAQAGHDEFAAEKAHSAKTTKSWLAGIAIGAVGLWGGTKLLEKFGPKKTKKSITPPKTEAELKAEAKVARKTARKAALDALEKTELAKGTSKVSIWFKKLGYRLKNAPKWLKVTGFVAAGTGIILSLMAKSAQKKMAAQQGQVQQVQEQRH